jgi:cytochrome c
MDSFEWNKIFGAVLGTVLFVASLNILINGLMTPHKAEKPGMEVAVAEEGAETGGEATQVAETRPDWGTLLPAADLAAGEKLMGRCQQCHDFSKGGPNKIGPNLYGIIGAKHAHIAGYPYSPAFVALKDKDWDYDSFYDFMKNPKAAIKGTKMSFAGLSKQEDRVNLIAYIRTLADAPVAIPAPNPAAPPPAEGAAPTEGAPATDGATPADGTTPAEGAAAPAEGAAPAMPAPASAPAPATAAPTAPAPAKPAGGTK